MKGRHIGEGARKERGQIGRGRRLNEGVGTEGMREGKGKGADGKRKRLKVGVGTEGRQEGKGTDMLRKTVK